MKHGNYIVAVLNLQALFFCIIVVPITIGFNQGRYRESEGAGAVPVTVQLLTGRLERIVTIRMYTVDGGATGPLMYKCTVLFSFFINM